MILKQEKKEESNVVIEEEIATKQEMIKREEVKKGPWVIIAIIASIILLLTLVWFVSISLLHSNSEKIAKGTSIKGIDVSGLTKQEATEKVTREIQSKMADHILLKTEGYEAQLSIEQLRVSYAIEEAVEKAYQIGRNKGLFKNGVEVLKVGWQKEKIEPNLLIDLKALEDALEDISAKLPNTVKQPAYYIEGNNLIITKGKEGEVIEKEVVKKEILDSMINLTYGENPIILKTKRKQPDPIAIDTIHKEIFKEAKDAYYTKDPYSVHPHVNGVDFDVEAAKVALKEVKEEYCIPLKITVPKVTTNQIGTEAFPDLLSTFSTRYAASNKDRTTNLKLASDKINGTVLMPGEVFSYNKVVGKRTIAAGYKEAAIYQDGKVVDGLGGGICQISTTLYNAALFANLEIVQRRNHQFVPSYVSAGRDATVVYGAIDFQFKNTRSYPIKLVCSVNKGIAKFEIYGLKEQNEPEVQVSSKVISKTATTIKSETYKTVKINGKVVSSGVINRDTYKRH